MFARKSLKNGKDSSKEAVKEELHKFLAQTLEFFCVLRIFLQQKQKQERCTTTTNTTPCDASTNINHKKAQYDYDYSISYKYETTTQSTLFAT